MDYKQTLEEGGYFILSDTATEVKTKKAIGIRRMSLIRSAEYLEGYALEPPFIQDYNIHLNPLWEQPELIFYEIYNGLEYDSYNALLSWYSFLKEILLITNEEFDIMTTEGFIPEEIIYSELYYTTLNEIRTSSERPSAKFIRLLRNKYINGEVGGFLYTTWKKRAIYEDTVWNGFNYDEFLLEDDSSVFVPTEENFVYDSINAYDLFINELKLKFYPQVSLVADGRGLLRTVLDKIYVKENESAGSLNPELDFDFDQNTEDTDQNIEGASTINWIKPIYGSSVSFKSRLNYLETSDNSLKIVPSSENNLIIKFNFKYLLNDLSLFSFLKEIQNAEGYRNLNFLDYSGMYKDVIGLVEDYSINKPNKNINEINISISSYFKAPIFNWKTSSILNLQQTLEYTSRKSYKKYEFVYFDPKKHNSDEGEKNKIDNFWFAKEDILAANDAKFDTTKWTKIFNHDSKFPFNFQNKYDFYQMDYRNSFVQNVKYKENSNILKKFEFTIENISDLQCKSILFFLEKKCGYRRFIYKFPFAFSGYMTFVCTEWNHVFNYNDSNTITATFIRDPSIASNFFKFIDYDYYTLNKIPSPYPKLLNSL